MGKNNNFFEVPEFTLPKHFKNKGKEIISLGKLVSFLCDEAEKIGIDLFFGFSVIRTIIKNGKIVGIETGDMGITKKGKKKKQYQMGIKINSKYVVFAEGSRGFLGKKLIRR